MVGVEGPLSHGRGNPTLGRGSSPAAGWEPVLSDQPADSWARLLDPPSPSTPTTSHQAWELARGWTHPPPPPITSGDREEKHRTAQEPFDLASLPNYRSVARSGVFPFFNKEVEWSLLHDCLRARDKGIPQGLSFRGPKLSPLREGGRTPPPTPPHFW